MGGYLEYPEYKDSGVEWLGKIPAHWEAKRSKFVVSKIGSGKTPRGGSEVYVDSGIMLIRSQNVYDDGLHLDDVVFITEEADSLQSASRVHPKDVLLNITGASIGRASVVPESFGEANVNQHVCILRPEVEKITPKYLHLCLCSQHAKDQIFSYENGISREGLNYQQASNLIFAVPPIPEQQSIARFLDYKTAQIDALIAKKESLLAKLAEKRTALISQAVTKGLDPTVPLKPSGIEWLGDIPAHWDVVRLNNVTSKITNGYVGPTRDILVDEGVRYIQSLHVKNGKILFDRGHYFVEEEWSKKHKKSELKADDVLLVQTGAETGQTALVSKEHENCNCHALIILTPIKEKVLGAFIELFLRCSIGQNVLRSIQTGALHPHLNCTLVKDVKLALPPVDEQREILEFMDVDLEEIANIEKSVQDVTAKLKEYRTALITNAVTGKIDVRDVKLPELDSLEVA